MGISTKGKRKITVFGQRYIWFVDGESDYSYGSHSIVVQVVSCDRKFIASYQLMQPDNARFVIIKGNEFSGVETGHSWKRFLCPKWESNFIVTPKVVRSLIEWCLDENKQLIEVVWKGEAITKK